MPHIKKKKILCAEVNSRAFNFISCLQKCEDKFKWNTCKLLQLYFEYIKYDLVDQIFYLWT